MRSHDLRCHNYVGLKGSCGPITCYARGFGFNELEPQHIYVYCELCFSCTGDDGILPLTDDVLNEVIIQRIMEQ